MVTYIIKQCYSYLVHVTEILSVLHLQCVCVYARTCMHYMHCALLCAWGQPCAPSHVRGWDQLELLVLGVCVQK